MPASDEFQFVSFDLSSDTNWCGQNITSWRLDPVGAAAGYDFEIDWMRFGPAGDFDGDGISDAEETLADLDGDGVPNLADTDSNGNGLPDSREKLLGLNPLSADADGDGMADAWELDHGIDPTDPVDGDMDEDRDGFSTRDEYIALSDPQNAADFFQISGVEGPQVTVDAKSGRFYILLCSTNLISNVWNPVDSASVDLDRSLTLVDTNQSPTAMYRVEVDE